MTGETYPPYRKLQAKPSKHIDEGVHWPTDALSRGDVVAEADAVGAYHDEVVPKSIRPDEDDIGSCLMTG